LQKNFVSKVASFMYKVAFRFPKKVLFQNEYDKRLFIKNKLVNRAIADVVPGSGLDLQKFRPQERIRKNKKFTFLLVSRLIHDKGILEYIEAIKKLKSKGVDAQFQILGDKDIAHRRGIPEKVIQQWIDNNIVDYLGRTDDVQPYLNSADCVVLPSYREGTPRTLLEAAGIGKPIVATDVPGCNNIVEDNYNGFLCKLKNADDLADKMHKMLLLDHSKLTEFGKNGRLKVEREFDERIVIDKYLHAIKEIKD
ncbi:MAG: glycosyltransferase family 4 protein, partial [Fulvivirga sp.]|nr:glycosyltransferase family 4 protein [Fulvivirga sp.]